MGLGSWAVSFTFVQHTMPILMQIHHLLFAASAVALLTMICIAFFTDKMLNVDPMILLIEALLLSVGLLDKVVRYLMVYIRSINKRYKSKVPAYFHEEVKNDRSEVDDIVVKNNGKVKRLKV